MAHRALIRLDLTATVLVTMFAGCSGQATKKQTEDTGAEMTEDVDTGSAIATQGMATAHSTSSDASTSFTSQTSSATSEAATTAGSVGGTTTGPSDADTSTSNTATSALTEGDGGTEQEEASTTETGTAEESDDGLDESSVTDTEDTTGDDPDHELPDFQSGDCPIPGSDEDIADWPHVVIYRGGAINWYTDAVGRHVIRDEEAYAELQTMASGVDIDWPQLDFARQRLAVAITGNSTTCGLHIRSARVYGEADWPEPQVLFEVEDISGGCDHPCDAQFFSTFMVVLDDVTEPKMCTFWYDACGPE